MVKLMQIIMPLVSMLSLANLPASITHIECAFSDYTSVARGKIITRAEFVKMLGCKFPSVAFGITLNSGEPPAVFGPLLPATYGDVDLHADLSSLRLSGLADHIATVICEPKGVLQGSAGPFDIAQASARHVLRNIEQAFAQRGLKLLCAPELEFQLLTRSDDGRSLQAARPWPDAPVQESESESYSLDRLSLFQPYFDDLLQACALEGIPMTGYAHEASCSQFEVNFSPATPIEQADAVWRFKRLARVIAARRGFIASFIAKPFDDQPGNGMHWHISITDLQGNNQCAGVEMSNAIRDANTSSGDSPISETLRHFIGGIQSVGAQAMAFMAPFDHSYRRFLLSDASPATLAWGLDDRALALRIPESDANNRRVEFRLPGGDINAHLVMAAVLGMGLHGLQRQQEPWAAGAEPNDRLPLSLESALAQLRSSKVLREVLGNPLVDLYCEIKAYESVQRSALSDPWREWDLRYLVEQA
jgi:glutamine synthetase